MRGDSAERSLETIVDVLCGQDLMALSWSEMTSAQRWAVGRFLIRRAIGAGVMLGGVVSRDPTLSVLGAVMYLDARLQVGARRG